MNNISFCITTTKNERNYIELLFKSLYRNLSHKNYPILVMIDEDNQNTGEFLQLQRKNFPNLKIIKNPFPIPLGCSIAMNVLFEMAQTEILAYLQSDMVICPLYDLEVIKYLTPNTFISSTRIEPSLHPPSSEKITYDFGLYPMQFDLEKFSEFSTQMKQNKMTDFWFAPFTFYKKVWTNIAGHDTIFRRSRGDSDILYRFTMMNLNIKQVWNANVYHFTCVSSRGLEWWTLKNKEQTKLQEKADQIELFKFLRKWPKFKHNTTFDPSKEYKYKISVNLYNTLPHDTSILLYYYYFDKIYIDNESVRQNVIKEFNEFDSVANILWNISNTEWIKYKKYTNQWSGEEIFVSTPIINEDIIIDVDLNFQCLEQISNSGKLLSYLNDMIHENNTEQNQTFRFDELNANITIYRAINTIKENLIVQNPSWKEIPFIEL